MNKIAILGGSFNPVTKAHLQIARYVYDHIDFNEVWLSPCYNHLQKTGLEDFGHRYKMCEIAIKPYGDFIKVSNWEMIEGLDGSAYSLMSRIKKDYDSGIVCGQSGKVDFSYIIGMDQANNFHTWKNWNELQRMVNFIVIPRMGVEADPNITWYLNPPHIYMNNSFPIMEASSTKIREMLKKIRTVPLQKYNPDSSIEMLYKKHATDELVNIIDMNVLEYICKNKLYEKET